jgi:RNA polymerase sigma-B factor
MSPPPERVNDSQIADVERLLAQHRVSGDPAVRLQAIELAIPLAERLARRFDGRGEDSSDLRQVAMIGLVNAADRYDPEHGSGFVPFAVATILGELKRHFRDRTWALRVPLSIKEQSLALRAAVERLEQLHHSVTVPALARETGLTQEQVLEGLEGYQARLTVSLDAPLAGREDDGESLGDLISPWDNTIELATDMAALSPAIAKLSPREQKLIELRFVHELSQSDIGKQLGVSQMQVSRLLRAVCERLRSELVDS